MYKAFASPVRIVSGEGSIQEVPSIVESFEAKRIMVFADPGVVEAGIVQKLEDQLAGAGLEYKIYSELVPEPALEVGNKALQTLRDFNADFVIGIGGGSSLDIAKAVAVLSKNDGNVEDYLNLTGQKELKEKGIPKVLIPTTSGTGAEVTDISVFSLEDTKDAITNVKLLADAAVVDPELTYTLPPHITASTGVDALTHAVESFVSVNATPLTEALAFDAIQRISANIRTAVWNGKDIQARQNMAWGSMVAGLSFYNAGVGGVHALAYPLGGLFKIPHGVSNAALLPYIFDHIWPSSIDKMARMAQALDVNTEHLNKREAAIAAVNELKNIVDEVGIPSTLDQFGIEEKDIETLAQNAIKQTRLLAPSPKPYTLDDIRGRYKAAFHGEFKYI
ncbi:iron-containing alcohol dehydrogenase [Salibacterium salarium]|uniref:Iron-containing alcohol dehydrogenase n=2 Tax=Salibacterium salarium TaxID=284579 RepID=A0A3R9PY45_9BACI|nr:iron-containing alcohol dehydrogenase [Salibacterium salarium]RSL29547.1 iron-containing alcohol dehydrogenase [Salibacterium salarium]